MVPSKKLWFVLLLLLFYDYLQSPISTHYPIWLAMLYNISYINLNINARVYLWKSCRKAVEKLWKSCRNYKEIIMSFQNPKCSFQNPKLSFQNPKCSLQSPKFSTAVLHLFDSFSTAFHITISNLQSPNTLWYRRKYIIHEFEYKCYTWSGKCMKHL